MGGGGRCQPAVLDQPRRRHDLGAGGVPQRAANLDGSSPHVIVTGQDNPAGVVVGGFPGSLLYWANTDGGQAGTINNANLDASSPGAIVTGQNAPAGVAVNSASVYWANPNGGTVNQANIDGSNPHALFANQGAPYGVAVGP